MERRLLKLAEAMQGRFADTSGSALSRPERVFRNVWELEAEVSNGGFNQYFFNSSGRHAREAPAALREIGAGLTASIVEAALGAVDHGMISWEDDSKRQAAIIGIGEVAQATLEALDAKFYAYPDDLTTMLYGYVADRRAEFVAAM